DEAPRPGDTAAQVQHRRPGADARARRQGPDLRGGHEALLADELAGHVGGHPRVVQRAVERLPHRDGPNAVRKRSRNAPIGQTGARRLGDMPSSQLHPAMRLITFGSRAITEIGTSWLGSSWPVTSVAG